MNTPRRPWEASGTSGMKVLVTRPAADYTPRLIGYHDGAIVPLEADYILWDDSPSWR